MISRLLLTVFGGLFLLSTLSADAYEMVSGKIASRWAKEVTPEKVLPEYPRPQMVRDQWKNLNGLWDYAIWPRDDACREKFDGQILVPFPVESSLSGVRKNVGEYNRLWYRRSFEVPSDWKGRRILMHFGAVDWDATVWVNGKRVGRHRGGYDPFAFDITDALKPSGPQEVIVSVWDPISKSYQPRGKQVLKPKGCYYTPVTGIWQTVWLEPVAATSIERLKITPDIDRGTVTVAADLHGVKDMNGLSMKAVLFDMGQPVAQATGPADKPLSIKIDDAKLWSPENPFLYDLQVWLDRGGDRLDQVKSYVGMRKIHVGKDSQGINRLMLNNKPVFQYGFLDQGWWPGGLYTAPTDEALRYDIEMTKAIGMNTIRKHVKVEPARWYYHCDKLGMLVWQDMPSGDRGIGRGKDLERSKESAAAYRRELKAMIDAVGNSPAIVMWVPFNEGWGQFDTKNVVEWIKNYDPTRPVNEASGWANRGSGDVRDAHKYPGPIMPPLEDNRVAVLGEFGGLGLPVEGHLWWNKRNWGYRNMKTSEQLTKAYGDLMTKLRPLIEKGLAAAIYTQTTDVEGEVNGLMTYDRKVLKIDAETLRKMHEPLYRPTSP